MYYRRYWTSETVIVVNQRINNVTFMSSVTSFTNQSGNTTGSGVARRRDLEPRRNNNGGHNL